MCKALKANWLVVVLFLLIGVVAAQKLITSRHTPTEPITAAPVDSTWIAPSLYTDQETAGAERELIIYGEELVTHTATYFGPHGSVLPVTNGMNCQHCHLDAGTRPWGNNFGAVYSTYPKFRERSGAIEDIYKRVNDCFERSLNGKAIDTGRREMQAIYAYLKWLGKEVPKGVKPYGSGLEKLAFLNRPADPVKGKQLFAAKCQGCHGADGEGILAANGQSFTTPPLWGPHSYNDGAGLYRLSNFASFIKNNMPFGQASHGHETLSPEEAWDLAAFVNSQPRPHVDQSKDWPDPSKKPVDFPFGPYADQFSPQQHKYGPYGPVAAAAGQLKKIPLK